MPEALYDEIAAWYDASVRGGSLLTDLALYSLLELIGDAATGKSATWPVGRAWWRGNWPGAGRG